MTIIKGEQRLFWVGEVVAANCRSEAAIDHQKLVDDYNQFRGNNRAFGTDRPADAGVYANHSYAVQQALARMENGIREHIYVSAIQMFGGNVRDGHKIATMIERTANRLQVPRYGPSMQGCPGCYLCDPERYHEGPGS